MEVASSIGELEGLTKSVAGSVLLADGEVKSGSVLLAGRSFDEAVQWEACGCSDKSKREKRTTGPTSRATQIRPRWWVTR